MLYYNMYQIMNSILNIVLLANALAVGLVFLGYVSNEVLS